MAKKQTSARVSTEAARQLRKLSDVPARARVVVLDGFGRIVARVGPVGTLRSVYASLVGQDETKGQAKKRRARRATR